MRQRLARAAALLGLVGLGLVAAPPPVAAQTDSHRQAAEAYMEVTRVRERMSATLEQLKASQLQALDKWYVSQGQRERATAYIDQLEAVVAKALSWEELEDDIVAAYVRVFTEAELRALVDFYRTPLGSASIRKREQLAQERLDIVQRQLKALLPEIQRLAEELDEPAPATKPAADQQLGN